MLLRVSRCLMMGLAGLVMSATSLVAGTSSSHLDISSDGRWLACANRDAGSVSIIDLTTNKVVHQVPVGNKPEGVSFLGKSTNVAVAVYGDDRVSLVSGAEGKVTGTIDVFDEPYGIVSNEAGTRIYVTLEYPAQVLEIDPAAKKVLRTFVTGPFARGIALSARENRVYVTEYYTGSVNAIDLESGKLADRWEGSASDNLARQIVLHPTRPKAYVPHIRSRVRINQGEGSIVPNVSVLDTVQGEGRRRNPVPMDSFNVLFVVANPWETDLSPDGKVLCTVFAGTDDMYVCDVLDDNYKEIVYRRVLRVGHNPRAVKFSPDGTKLYVLNALDFNVVAYRTDTFQPIATIAVCDNPLSSEIHRGKILFYSALQPMVGRRWISCASCHPDGDHDGRTWQNPEGLRNTTALFGMAWTHPLHWSADRDETQDFEHTVRSPLMQGQGLVKGPIPAALADPLKGRSADLDALAAYSNTHKVALSPHAKGGLSAAAKRGQQLFASETLGCAKCHSGPFYTDSTPAKPFKLHDVGTGTDDPTEKMGPKYDTPTLLGVYRSAPYLHHGKAATLEEVLTTQNKNDRHGKTSHLKKEEISDLVEFLKGLPYEDPQPAAKAAGMVAIER